ncbi:MAG: glycogen/starch/alpha-glucan family phosphorylase [Oscillospiraceae bacterium]|nr:glycogen/starch/alpha-glucan family phosphorylase [Oscillospiraceae bacterium]
MIDKTLLKNDFEDILRDSHIQGKKRTPAQLHDALSRAIMKQAVPMMSCSAPAGRSASYLSMEFLVGRAVYNNILCLGLRDYAEELLSSAGGSLSDLEEIEDAALGNGGLGRLAACFLDSAATMKLPLTGYGIRYKYGLFKQNIEDGFQREYADDWTRFGDPWSRRVDEEAVLIHYSTGDVKAVPYDMPIFGYKNDFAGTLRLWQAEPINAFDFDAFNRQDYFAAAKGQIEAENISGTLYPNDDARPGKILRLKQEYFFSAASMSDLVRKHIEAGRDIYSFAEYNTVQLNDTHPVIAIPELIRILVNERNVPFAKALEIAEKTFNYTNHTIMAEALEKWDCGIVEELLPEVYGFILRINEEFISDMYRRGIPRDEIEKMQPVSGGVVHMAKMAIYCSQFVNGVAKIHTEILKKDALPEWYEMFPERFQNKTNGITPRRWLALCNPMLSALITQLLGSEGWVTNLTRISELRRYADDREVLGKFKDIKYLNKAALAKYIKEHEGVEIDPNSMFDIQIKRLHEYKRQLLNAFGILYIYYGIKDGSIANFAPTTFIFGAKAAPGYVRAKAIIKFINEIADLVNNDESLNGALKVVYVRNYNVSYAEKLVVAADISEQISTAGTEASGTGNMKFMLNGTMTLGTYDGANVEICEEAGEENNYIFGARVEDLAQRMPTYDPRKIYSENTRIARVLNTLIDGTFSDGGNGSFRELYYSLLDGASWHRPDHYYLLGDLENYVQAKLKANSDFCFNHDEFIKKCWLNMTAAGKFSSDRTIADYAKEIWKIEPADGGKA